MPGLVLNPLPDPLPNVHRSVDPEFGRVVQGVNLASLSPEEVAGIKDALYKHSILVFSGADITPEDQLAITQAFDEDASVYGHGNKGRQAKSILHPDLKTIPRLPQVQVIGNGHVAEHEGLKDIQLKHPHHKTFHDTKIPESDDLMNTRFYRWHIDAALYDLAPPRVTSLYALSVPAGRTQTLRYDDGTGDELQVPLGTTAFVSGKTMFERLSPAEKSLAARSTIVYAPHPYVWMSRAASNSTGLGLVSQGRELSEAELPEWEESKIKRYPMLWKCEATGALHLQVHPSAIKEVLVSPVPESTVLDRAEALYPDGAHITDLEQVRSFVYRLQRPAITPSLVYAHDWQEKDFVLFHNEGVLHTVVGAFAPEELRLFHQCNLAGSADPRGPSEEDIRLYA